jgi:hypothetical protein
MYPILIAVGVFCPAWFVTSISTLLVWPSFLALAFGLMIYFWMLKTVLFDRETCRHVMGWEWNHAVITIDRPTIGDSTTGKVEGW